MATRRIEAWLERGGISDKRRLKGRGKPFEVQVREVIGKSLAENPLITDYAILRTALKPAKGGEEIDLLSRIGNSVIVGEVKCFLAPVEPMDRLNCLNALNDAAEQARRKSGWVNENRSELLARLCVTDAARVVVIRLVPILNQGNGFGIDLGGAAVTDLHFLASSWKRQLHRRREGRGWRHGQSPNKALREPGDARAQPP